MERLKDMKSSMVSVDYWWADKSQVSKKSKESLLKEFLISQVSDSMAQAHIS
jgi:hypothetical protein